MDFKLELVPVPVSDVDCAKTFYATRPASTSISTSATARRSAACS